MPSGSLLHRRFKGELMETEAQEFRRRGIIRALWCIDSDTSREYLINLDTQEIIAERVDGKIVNPQERIK